MMNPTKMISTKTSLFLLFLLSYSLLMAQERPRELGLHIGLLPVGPKNAITDVEGVRVGQLSLRQGDRVRTGVTAILPHAGNLFQDKVPAAIYIGNGFGKLAGYSQVEELGNLETPVVLTNTLSVPTAADALITYTFQQQQNQEVRSVNPVVGETNDGRLNDIRGRHVQEADVLRAISRADTGAVAEGNVGAGTGTVCFGFKGGIGTASRRLPPALGGYTLGVLVQTNFGGVLQIDGAPIGRELGQFYLKDQLEHDPDGSCMIVVATDAPLGSRNLKRLAKRALLGLGKTGGIASNGSGDYVIAFSTHPALRVPYRADSAVAQAPRLANSAMSPLFMAVIEATEEAIINSLFAAETMTANGRTIEALPQKRVMEILRRYNRLSNE